MKKLLFISIILFVLLNANAQTHTPLDTAIWKTDYESAKHLALENMRPILMVFSGSDWCKPCVKLREQILVSPEFSAWAKDEAVCLSVDFPSQKKNQLPPELKAHNDQLAEKFNKNGIFPLVILVTADGTVLGSIGYENVSPAEYIESLNKIIHK